MARLKSSPASNDRAKDKLIKVVWADAHSLDTYEWKSVAELKIKGDEYLITSVGFKLPDAISTKKHLIIYQSRTPDGDLDHVLAIPVAMIRSVTPL